MRKLRFLHIVLIAVTGLLALKVVTFMAGERAGDVLAQARAEEGGAPASPPAPLRLRDPSGENIHAPAAQTLQQLQTTNSEQELLQSLAKRRDELDKRAADLDTREKLMQATEEKVNKKLDEMRKIEADLNAQQKKEEQEEGQPGEQMQKLVAIYEQMKPKDAAMIFEKMATETALPLLKAMNPRKVSPLMAAMNPDLASKLTAMMSGPRPNAGPPILAASPTVGVPSDPSQLPKIGPEGLGK